MFYVVYLCIWEESEYTELKKKYWKLGEKFPRNIIIKTKIYVKKRE